MINSLPIVYNSGSVKVINKPSGIISTKISDLICHRLDRDTSGLLIVAKNKDAKDKIQEQFKDRQVKKEYLAMVVRKFESKRTVEGWLERDPKDKRLMRLAPGYLQSGNEFSRVEKSRGKNKRYSKTVFYPKKLLYRKIFKSNREQFNYFSLISCQLITGRKHQIRAHLKYLDQPILGDDWYGSKISKKVSSKLDITRLMLHAHIIEFYDPGKEKRVSIKSDIPDDFNKLLKYSTDE